MYILETAKSPFHPIDQNHAVYTSCEDAVVRGGIRPNAGEPIKILLSDNTTTECKHKVKNDTFCPSDMYSALSKCFTVHNEYVTNMEASRYIFY